MWFLRGCLRRSPRKLNLLFGMEETSKQKQSRKRQRRAPENDGVPCHQFFVKFRKQSKHEKPNDGKIDGTLWIIPWVRGGRYESNRLGGGKYKPGKGLGRGIRAKNTATNLGDGLFFLGFEMYF